MKEGTIKQGMDEIQYRIYKRSKKNVILKITSTGRVEISIPRRSAYKIGEEVIRKNFEAIYPKVSKVIDIERVKQEKKHIKVLGRDIPKGEKDREEILHTEAERVFRRLIEKWAPRIGVRPQKLRIKNMKTAWGICYSNKSITLNLKLIQMDIKIVEYVIIHELCHLIHMNHSREFWELVESQLPKFREERNRLKSLQKDSNYFI